MILDSPPAGVSSVTSARLFPDAERADEDGAVDVAVAHEDGAYVIDVIEAPPGRWYPTLTGLRTNGTPVTYRHRYLDLHVDPRLIVSAEDVATEARIPLPLKAVDRDLVERQILNAQADVAAFLHRPLMPVEYVQRGLWDFGGTWALTAHGDDEMVRVVSVVAETEGGVPTGTFTVRYLAGMNARDDVALEPIRRYVVAHAMNSTAFTALWTSLTGAKGAIKSASTQGQTVSYEKASLGGGGAAGSGAPGALPTLTSLTYWRLISVHQAPTEYANWRRY